MTLSDIWEDVWEEVSQTFERIANSLNAIYPTLSWSAGHSDNKAFPFRAYVAFNRGLAGSEDVIASVDFQRSAEMLRYSVDIGRDDGSVLANGPTGTIGITYAVETARPEIEVAIRGIRQFLETSEPVLRDALDDLS